MKKLAIPGLAWFGLFCFVPIAIVLLTALQTRGPYGQTVWSFQGSNFSRVCDLLYLKILWASLKLATLTVLGTLLAGYPIALLISHLNGFKKKVLTALIILPFWTNTIVKTLALKTLLVQFMPHIPGPLAVQLGMIMNYLPFMILPLVAGLERIERSFTEAAFDLFATPLKALFFIIIPLSKPAILTGCLFVFVPALGEFIIPEVLGDSEGMFVGTLISDQFLKARDWPFGSAMSIFLMSFLPLSFWVFQRTSALADDYTRAHK